MMARHCFLKLPLLLFIAPFGFIDLKANSFSRLFGRGQELPDRLEDDLNLFNNLIDMKYELRSALLKIRQMIRNQLSHFILHGFIIREISYRAVNSHYH